MRKYIFCLSLFLSLSSPAAECTFRLVTTGPDGLNYLETSALSLSEIKKTITEALKTRNYTLSAQSTDSITLASADITYDGPVRLPESYFLFDIQTSAQNFSQEGHGKGINQKLADKRALKDGLKKVISKLYPCNF